MEKRANNEEDVHHSESESSSEEEGVEPMMVWDDDEDYVPPVILNEQFMQEKLPMFGKDEEAEAQENADLFSKEQIK